MPACAGFSYLFSCSVPLEGPRPTNSVARVHKPWVLSAVWHHVCKTWKLGVRLPPAVLAVHCGFGGRALALRSDSYPDPAGFDTRVRYVEEKDSFLEAFRNMADVYQDRNGTTIADPRVERSWGGGAMPEQHWGYLKDGRCFYLRLRRSWASLQLGDVGLDPNVDLPLVNPAFKMQEFNAVLLSGGEYPVPFWLQPRPEVEVYPNDEWVGTFRTDEDRQRTFTTLLDMILNEPTGTGWCAPSP